MRRSAKTSDPKVDLARLQPSFTNSSSSDDGRRSGGTKKYAPMYSPPMASPQRGELLDELRGHLAAHAAGVHAAVGRVLGADVEQVHDRLLLGPRLEDLQAVLAALRRDLGEAVRRQAGAQ